MGSIWSPWGSVLADLIFGLLTESPERHSREAEPVCVCVWV